MQNTITSEKKTNSALQLFSVGLLTIATALGINLVVRALAFAFWPLSPRFLPLQIGPLSGVTLVLVGGGVLVYALVARFSRRPARTYTTIALFALLLSLVPPALLIVHPDPTALPGVTPLAASLLLVVHSLDALIAIVLLTRLAPSKGRTPQGEEHRL